MLCPRRLCLSLSLNSAKVFRLFMCALSMASLGKCDLGVAASRPGFPAGLRVRTRAHLRSPISLFSTGMFPDPEAHFSSLSLKKTGPRRVQRRRCAAAHLARVICVLRYVVSGVSRRRRRGGERTRGGVGKGTGEQRGRSKLAFSCKRRISLLFFFLTSSFSKLKTFRIHTVTTASSCELASQELAIGKAFDVVMCEVRAE